MTKQNNELANLNKKYYEKFEKLNVENIKLFFNYNDEINNIMNFLNSKTNVFLLKIIVF